MLRNQADMVICQYVVAYADGRFEKRAPENGPEEILNQQQALSELLIDGRLTNHVWRKLYWRNKVPKDIFQKDVILKIFMLCRNCLRLAKKSCI